MSETVTLTQLAEEFTEATYALMVAANNNTVRRAHEQSDIAVRAIQSIKSDIAVNAIQSIKSIFAARIEEILSILITPTVSSRADIYMVGYIIGTIKGNNATSGLQVWETAEARSEEEALSAFRKHHVSTLDRRYIVQWISSCSKEEKK